MTNNGNNNYNWETIKRQYIQGIKQENGTKKYPSYQDLSNTHGCSKGAITNHSNKDPNGTWEEQRERYLNKVEQKVEEKKTELDAENIVEDDLQCESMGRKIIRIVNKKLDQLEQQLDNDKYVSGIDILNTTTAGKNGQDIIKIAQGEITNRIKVEGGLNGFAQAIREGLKE